jgi:hypothetical protein
VESACNREWCIFHPYPHELPWQGYRPKARRSLPAGGSPPHACGAKSRSKICPGAFQTAGAKGVREGEEEREGREVIGTEETIVLKVSTHELSELVVLTSQAALDKGTLEDGGRASGTRLLRR